MKTLWLACLAAVAFGPVAGAAPPDVDTFPNWNGSNAFGPFGEPHSATVGQTFRVPASETAPALAGYRFAVNDYNDPGLIEFEAFLMEWDGAKPAGPVLFRSGLRTTTNNAGLGNFEFVDVDVGGLPLTPGRDYVAFLSAVGRFDGVVGRGAIATVGANANSGNVYAGGTLVFSNAASFDTLTAEDWPARPGDLAFAVRFVPEPAAGLVPASLALLFLRRRPADGRRTRRPA